MPHPNCRFPKNFCRSEGALFPAHLDAIRLRVLPMAVVLKDPSVFMRAIIDAPKKERSKSLGILPSPMSLSLELNKRFQKIKSCTAIQITNKTFKNLRKYFIQTCFLSVRKGHYCFV